MKCQRCGWFALRPDACNYTCVRCGTVFREYQEQMGASSGVIVEDGKKVFVENGKD